MDSIKRAWKKTAPPGALRRRLKASLPLHGMMLPGVLATLLFAYIPMYGIVIAFKNFMPRKGIFWSDWAGLKHFRRLFSLPEFPLLLRNTLVISVLKISTLLLFSLILALLLNEVKRRPLRAVLQGSLIFPHFLSWIVLGNLIRSILDKSGLVNQILMLLGGEATVFLQKPGWFWPILVVTNLWQEAGFSAILFTAAIAGVDSSLYEASRIDGANRWQQTIHITLASIKPFIVLMLVLNIGGILNAGFDQIFNLYNGTVLRTGDIIDTFVYRVGLQGAQYSFGTAVGLFKSVISCLLIGVSYYLADKFAKYRVF